LYGDYKAALSTAQCALYEPAAPLTPLICERQSRGLELNLKNCIMLQQKVLAHEQ
jgi:hypothetical protein